MASAELNKRASISQDQLKTKPLISIVVPCYNTPAKYLQPMVYSVINQLYKHWELVLANGSTEAKAQERIQACQDIDTRVRVIQLKCNLGISGNTNEAIKAARGEFIAFLDHDDTLTDDALFEVVKAINEHPQAGLIYSDEDKIDDQGRFQDPHLKPDFSPDLLTYVNYITHFLVIRRDLIKKVGMLDSTRDGAQDYDLILKIADLRPEIVHIRKILYHWRITRGSTAQDFAVKPKVRQAGVEALKDHLRRNELKGQVSALMDRPGFYRVSYDSPANQEVSLIVGRFGSGESAQKCAESLLAKTDIEGLELEIISPFKLEISAGARFKTVNSEPFLDRAVETARGDVLIFINEIVQPEDENWLRELVGIANLPRVGAAAPLLKTEEGTITDCGLVETEGQLSTLFVGEKVDSYTCFGYPEWSRNVDALSGRVFALKRGNLKFFEPEIHRGGFGFNTQFFYDLSRRHELYNVVWTSARLNQLTDTPLRSGRTFFNPQLRFYRPKLVLRNEYPEERDD